MKLPNLGTAVGVSSMLDVLQCGHQQCPLATEDYTIHKARRASLWAHRGLRCVCAYSSLDNRRKMQIQIVIPRSPVQAKGLLLASIRDPNPVIFMEPKILYRSAVEQVPIDDYELPLGRAEVLVPGADLTLLTWGTPLYHCETALSLLADPPPSLAPLVPESARRAQIELIDLRTVLPWDVETVVESVQRTGRLVVVHEASRTAGVGAEIAAEIQSKAFLKLHAPVRRVTGWE